MRMEAGRRPALLLLTGARGVGKSTVCARTVELARDQGLVCGGIITLRGDAGTNAPMATGDTRYVLDIRTGVRRLLTLPVTAPSSTSVLQGRFRFDADTLAWGRNVLLEAAFASLDLLVVDELGPLEVERGQGWAAVIKALPHTQARMVLVVVRPELVDRLLARLPERVWSPWAGGWPVVWITQENREWIPAMLVAALLMETTGATHFSMDRYHTYKASWRSLRLP